MKKCYSVVCLSLKFVKDVACLNYISFKVYLTRSEGLRERRSGMMILILYG